MSSSFSVLITCLNNTVWTVDLSPTIATISIRLVLIVMIVIMIDVIIIIMSIPKRKNNFGRVL